jgi:hypothetical protein
MFVLTERKLVPLVATLVVFAGISCSSTMETAREAAGKEEVEEGEPLEGYEQQFNPADYNPSLAAIQKLVEADTSERIDEYRIVEPTPPQTIPGFRIQVLSTTEIDSADAVRDELSNLPESVGIYMVYDSPYYKVRVGDFPSRPAANPLLKIVMNRGFADAWIVADRVLKNPPLRKPTPPAQDKPAE